VCFGFYLQNLSPKHIEFLFKIRLIERVAAIGQFQGDICPVFRRQCIKRGWKEDALLHFHVLPLMVDKIANDFIYGLTKKILVAEHSLDCLSDSLKPRGFLLMLGTKIAYVRCGNGITRFELLEDDVLFGMVA
jgi:hypothetical protein